MGARFRDEGPSCWGEGHLPAGVITVRQQFGWAIVGVTEHELPPDAAMVTDLRLKLRAEMCVIAECMWPGFLRRPLDSLACDIGLGAVADKRRKGRIVPVEHWTILPVTVAL